MKKLEIIGFIFASVFSVLTSCIEDNAPPAITVSVDKEFVYSGDTISIPYEIPTDSAIVTFNIIITAEAEISILKFGVNVTSAKPDEDAFGKTSYSVTTNAKILTGVVTPYLIEVTDKAGVTLIKEVFLFVKKMPVPLTIISGNIKLGAANSAYGSYLDIDSAQVYRYTQVYDTIAGKPIDSIARLIDAVMNDTALYNIGKPAIASETGTMFAPTNMDTTKFSTLTDIDLKGFTASLVKTIPVSKNAVIYFKTKPGTEGFILVRDYILASDSTSNDASINIEIKAKK